MDGEPLKITSLRLPYCFTPVMSWMESSEQAITATAITGATTAANRRLGWAGVLLESYWRLARLTYAILVSAVGSPLEREL